MTATTNADQNIEERTPGSWYGVVLGDPAHDPTKERVGGVPVPDFGHECVCCNSADTEATYYDPSSGPFVCAPIPFPLCASCRDHVHLNENRAGYIVGAAFLGIGLIVLGFIVHIIAAAVGALLFTAALGVLLLDRHKQRSHSESGHHAGLEIAGTFGVCSVRTMNHRIASRLIEQHQGQILRVK